MNSIHNCSADTRSHTVHYVYILQCINDTYYTGYTTDMTRRYQEHVNKSGKCRYTRSFSPKKLAAFWCFDNKSTALKEEARIKKLSRSEKEKMIFEYGKTKFHADCMNHDKIVLHC